MVTLRHLVLLACSAATALPAALASGTAKSAWPNGPFATSGRWVTDAAGSKVTYAGVNWPGHVEIMLPEGLQYQSISTIVSKIKSLGLNSIRLTYAIEMIDQIKANGDKDIPIKTAFIDALGKANGTAVYDRVVFNNPSFNSSTTRLQVFDAVAAECAKQEIYVHLDNHVSKAGWCCSPIDGNAWWGDLYFSAANWTRGLSYMAKHGKSWPNLMSMSLRNELRQPLLNETLYEQTYNWETWYRHVKDGAAAIRSENPDVLIFLSGLNSDVDLGPVAGDTALTPGDSRFSRDDFGERGDDGLVLELHNYEFTYAADSNCTELSGKLLEAGFSALDAEQGANPFPVVLSEFGFSQQGAEASGGKYGSCVADFLKGRKAGWMYWVLAGSYYLREGRQDSDEPWGLLTHDWAEWRSSEYIDGGFMPLVKATLEDDGDSVDSDGGSAAGSSEGSEDEPKDNGAGVVVSLLPGSILALAGGIIFFAYLSP